MTSSEYLFGDIVLLAFPFSDSVRKKKRPALVLFDGGDSDLVLCRISSKPAMSEFDIPIDNWAETGLLLPSCIRLKKIATIEMTIVKKKFGALDIKTKHKVKNELLNLIKKNIL